MGCNWQLRWCAAVGFSGADRRRYQRAVHRCEVRRRLLRIAGHEDRAPSSDFALLRNVWASAYRRTWCAAAANDSDQNRLQAGKVADGDESYECVAAGRLLGRSRVFGILRVV